MPIFLTYFAACSRGSVPAHNVHLRLSTPPDTPPFDVSSRKLDSVNRRAGPSGFPFRMENSQPTSSKIGVTPEMRTTGLVETFLSESHEAAHPDDARSEPG